MKRGTRSQATVRRLGRAPELPGKVLMDWVQRLDLLPIHFTDQKAVNCHSLLDTISRIPSNHPTGAKCGSWHSSEQGANGFIQHVAVPRCLESKSDGVQDTIRSLLPPSQMLFTTGLVTLTQYVKDVSTPHLRSSSARHPFGLASLTQSIGSNMLLSSGLE